MDEFIKIVFLAISLVLSGAVTLLLIPAIGTFRSKLSASQQQELTFWVTVGVRWAKQWLASESGKEKKKQVMDFVRVKVAELGLPFSDDDIDKAVESVYSSIKDVTAAGSEVFIDGLSK